MWLASHPDQPQTVQQIAKATHVPAAYLAKVMHSLGKAGLVEAKRGLGGGYSLTKKHSDLTILEVVNTVEPIERIHSCPLGRNSHSNRLCPLHQRLDEAIGLIEEAFGNTKIADLVVESLCDNSNGKPDRDLSCKLGGGT